MLKRISSFSPSVDFKTLQHDTANVRFSLHNKESSIKSSSESRSCWQSISYFISNLWKTIKSFFCDSNKAEDKKDSAEEAASKKSNGELFTINSLQKTEEPSVWEFRYPGLQKIEMVKNENNNALLITLSSEKIAKNFAKECALSYEYIFKYGGFVRNDQLLFCGPKNVHYKELLLNLYIKSRYDFNAKPYKISLEKAVSNTEIPDDNEKKVTEEKMKPDFFSSSSSSSEDVSDEEDNSKTSSSSDETSSNYSSNSTSQPLPKKENNVENISNFEFRFNGLNRIETTENTSGAKKLLITLSSSEKANEVVRACNFTQNDKEYSKYGFSSGGNLNDNQLYLFGPENVTHQELLFALYIKLPLYIKHKPYKIFPNN